MTTLVPMTDAEFAAWREAAIPNYARDKVASGQWRESESLAKSRAAMEALLPAGIATPFQHLWTIRDGAHAHSVGTLWVAEQQGATGRIAYVFDLMIEPTYRRRGHARRAFEALEQKVRELQLDGISLHVFGHNAAARALYDSLGYAPTNIMLFKPITRA